MKKKLYLLLGNGNSISIVNQLDEYRQSIGKPMLEIDLSNLFYYGDCFNFPMTNDPFLTEKHCPRLWDLGVRPKMEAKKAKEIISQIMTCANVYALSKNSKKMIGSYIDKKKDIKVNGYSKYQASRVGISYSSITDDEISGRLYFAAYGEFSSYIRYLMIYYNSQILDDELKMIEVPLINYIKNHYRQFSKIIITSYNYDIIIERLLLLHNLSFQLGCFSQDPSKIILYKPHGSISFSYKMTYLEEKEYKIPYNELCSQQKIRINDFIVKYHFNDDFPIHNGLLPPGGEAERYAMCYYQKIKQEIIFSFKKSHPKDIYYIIGSAYGKFDRLELDQINIQMNKFVHTIYVDPYPNKDYEAVLSSLFPLYKQVPVFLD